MDIHTLMKKFSASHDLEAPKEENGMYELVLDGYPVQCSGNSRHILLTSVPGKVDDRDGSNELLLSRSMGFIRDQRACLSIDEEAGNYCLYQRIPTENLTLQSFQTALENFGGCHRFVAELIQQAGQ